ncbi:MAG TPA: glycosyltransferase [bacterium]|nr:glycosyltransferase [bacterium]
MKRSPLRVLWITNMFHRPEAPDFRGIFVTQLWNALASRPGIEASLEVIAQDRGRLDYLGANKRILRRWNEGRYDLAHVHYGLTGLAALLLPRSAPVVATLYGSDVNSTLQRWLSKASLGRASRRIYVSKRLADRWPSLRNEILPNGVDFEVVRPVDREEACRELGLDSSRMWILFGGAPANPVKDYALFQEAMNLVKASEPRAQELILSEKGQAYERVVLKLNAASCLLFTSRRGSEGSPTVVKESLAVGLPVVSVEVGDAPEMLAGIRPGAVVPWLSPNGGSPRAELAKQLAGSVLHVLRTGERSNGRALRQNLRQEVLVDRLVEIYREVAG